MQLSNWQLVKLGHPKQRQVTANQCAARMAAGVKAARAAAKAFRAVAVEAPAKRSEDCFVKSNTHDLGLKNWKKRLEDSRSIFHLTS
jgi:hypothetical protein